MSTDWDGAHCLTVDPEVMQPEKATTVEVELAKAVCDGCPLRRECLALAHSQRSLEGNLTAYGVHAGRWFGPDPTWEEVHLCADCGGEFRTKPRASGGSSFCSTRCRVRSHRSKPVA